MRAFIIAATSAALTLAGSTRIASAQAEAVIPLQRDHRGGLSCPANYEIRGNACVSILAGRGVPGAFDRGYGNYRYRDDYFEAPRRLRPPRRRHRDDHDDGGRATVQPRLDYRGELVCPRNFVIQGNLCISLWYVAAGASAQGAPDDGLSAFQGTCSALIRRAARQLAR